MIFGKDSAQWESLKGTFTATEINQQPATWRKTIKPVSYTHLDQTKEYVRHLKNFLDFVFTQYKNQNKSHIMVAIGCTGGHHRSVTITNWLYSHYRDQYTCYKSHRDKKVG